MATVSDTARRRPREQAADKSKFTKATASRAQCWRGQKVRVSSCARAADYPTDETPWFL